MGCAGKQHVRRLCIFCALPLTSVRFIECPSLITDMIRICETHRSSPFHIICFLWHAAEENRPSCLVCDLSSLPRMKGPYCYATGFEIGMRDFPTSIIYQEASELLSKKEKDNLVYSGSRQGNTTNRRKVQKYNTIAKKYPRVLELNIERLGRRLVYHFYGEASTLEYFLTVDDMDNTKGAIASSYNWLDGLFFHNLSSRQLLLFAKKVLPVKFFGRQMYLSSRQMIIERFFHSAAAKLSPDELARILSNMPSNNSLKMLHIIIGYCAEHKLRVSAKAIMMIMIDILELHDVRSQRKILFILVLLNFKFDFLGELNHQRALKDSFKGQRPYKLTRTLKYCLESYSQVTKNQPFLTPTPQGLFTQETDISKLSLGKEFVTCGDLQIFANVLRRGGIPLKHLYWLFEAIFVSKTVTSPWHFLLEAHPETELFSEFIVMSFKRFLLRKNSGIVSVCVLNRILEFLMRLKCCTPCRLEEIIYMLRINHFTASIYFCLSILCYRADLPSFPDSTLKRIYECVKDTLGHHSKLRFLMAIYHIHHRECERQ